MAIPYQTEVEINRDVEALRERFTRTQELYREVSALLFFRYGITPTANKLYQLVRKGSMSAPTEALTRFWAEIREKSRTRIEHPDLPESLKATAGDLVGRFWEMAQAAARESVVTHQTEADERISVANAQLNDALAQLELEEHAFERANEQLKIANQTIEDFRANLAVEAALRDTVNKSLDEVKDENNRLIEIADKLRKQFTVELKKIHRTQQLAEERFQLNEKRVLLDLDRERTMGARLKKELDVSISRTLELVEKHKAEVQKLHNELGVCRQLNGQLTGKLQVTATNFEQTNIQVNRMYVELQEVTKKEKQSREESNQLRKQLENTQKALKRFQVNKPAVRSIKKAAE